MIKTLLPWLLAMECAAQSLRNFTLTGKKIAGAGINYQTMLPILKISKPAKPVIFLKPTSSYITKGEIKIPAGFEVNEEIELGVVIGKEGKFIKESEALDYVGGYCVALDLTSTSELAVARPAGLPWSIGKGFDTACPVSRFITKKEIPDPSNVQLWCTVNGKTIQEGNTKDLIFSVPQLISFISQYLTLERNDLILTGTPPGAGPIAPGDVIEGGIKDILTIKFPVVAERYT